MSGAGSGVSELTNQSRLGIQEGEGALKRQERFRQRGNTELQYEQTYSVKAYKPILVETPNKSMYTHNMSSLIYHKQLKILKVHDVVKGKMRKSLFMCKQIE